MVGGGDGIRRLIRMTPEYMGFEVPEASSGAEDLAMAREHRLDLVLIDVRMPEVNGITACEAIRADPFLSAIPVVMLSAANQPRRMLKRGSSAERLHT